MKRKINPLKPTMTIQNTQVTDYIYVLSNGQELAFKDKKFPTSKLLVIEGQFLLF